MAFVYALALEASIQVGTLMLHTELGIQQVLNKYLLIE